MFWKNNWVQEQKPYTRQIQGYSDKSKYFTTELI